MCGFSCLIRCQLTFTVTLHYLCTKIAEETRLLRHVRFNMGSRFNASTFAFGSRGHATHCVQSGLSTETCEGDACQKEHKQLGGKLYTQRKWQMAGDNSNSDKQVIQNIEGSISLQVLCCVQRVDPVTCLVTSKDSSDPPSNVPADTKTTHLVGIKTRKGYRS